MAVNSGYDNAALALLATARKTSATIVARMSPTRLETEFQKMTNPIRLYQAMVVIAGLRSLKRGIMLNTSYTLKNLLDSGVSNRHEIPAHPVGQGHLRS